MRDNEFQNVVKEEEINRAHCTEGVKLELIELWWKIQKEIDH
jgi:hypothetical protein